MASTDENYMMSIIIHNHNINNYLTSSKHTEPQGGWGTVTRPSLQNSIFRWDAIFDAIEDCVLLLDHDFNIIETNKAMRDFFKKTDDEITGKHCWELVHGSIEPPKSCPMAKMMKSRQRESEVIELVGRYMKVTVDPILDENGAIKGAVHILRDIDKSERKEIGIRESEKKYRELVETMSDVVFNLDFDGNVIDTSPSMERIIGRPREELIGKHFSDFVNPDDLSRAEEEFVNAIQGIGRPIEIRLITIDGTSRWVRINALLTMRDGEPDNLLCVLSDIHEKKLAEESLVKRTKDAEDARIKASAYFDFLAHDIANLLSPVMAYAELMRLDAKTTEPCRIKAGKIVDQARRASSFILSLRRLEDVELARQEQMESRELGMIMDEAVDRVRAEYEDIRISATIVHPKERVEFKGGRHLESIIVGILENSVSAADRDEIALGVKASLAEENGHGILRLELTDDGPGITDDLKESFTASEDPGKRFETGISRGVASTLLVSSAIVNSLGGELRIENRIPGDFSKGSRIVIEFPQERYCGT